MNAEAPKQPPIVRLSEMQDGQEAICFALLTSKEQQQTRDGKPFWKVTFRDSDREVTFPVWADSPFAAACRDDWKPGTSFKILALYRETQYGPQLELRKIRPVRKQDAQDGYDPESLLPRSAIDPAHLHAQLLSLAREHLQHQPLQEIVTSLLTAHRSALLDWPMSLQGHHAYPGGLLEHTLSVVKISLSLLQHYLEDYPQLAEHTSPELIVAGAILHDLGKLRELSLQDQNVEYSLSGTFCGHPVQGRDMLREAALGRNLDRDLQLRLEHVLLSHPGTAEHGAVRPPQTVEAYIIHAADDFDAKFHPLIQLLLDRNRAGSFTLKHPQLGQSFYKGSLQKPREAD